MAEKDPLPSNKQNQGGALSSPEPTQKSQQTGLTSFIKENALTMSPPNLRPQFTDGFHPPVLSLLMNNNSREEIASKNKKEGFLNHFENALKCMQGDSVKDSSFFSELDIVNCNGSNEMNAFESQFERKNGVEPFESKDNVEEQNENDKQEEQSDHSNNRKQNDQEEVIQQSREQEPEVKQSQAAVEVCRCTNSKCLKLYCVCFSNGNFCSSSCKCSGCSNTSEKEQEVKEARKNTLSRNPIAFTSKVEVVLSNGIYQNEDSMHNQGNKAMLGYKKGCKCKKTLCKKKYCECFNAGVKCTYLCICEECQNKDDDNQKKPPPPQANNINIKRHLEDNNHDHQSTFTQDTPEQYALRKKMKIDFDEQNQPGQQAYENQNGSPIRQEQGGREQNEQLQQSQDLQYDFNTPAFNILDQKFDPNSVYLVKNQNHSNFSLDS